MLEELGYEVDSGIVDASRLGVAQRRRRSITIASLKIAPCVEEAVASLEVKERSLAWAIADLLDVPRTHLMDQPPQPNDLTKARIDYLFDNDLFDLPDSERPDCHRLKPHSYISVYGRMHWDRPAQTLTTGFGVMGRGRFVHPSQRRTITPHEAARVQFFPDFFDFGLGPRTLIHKVIGNAVPPKLGYALGVHLLR
jgi:DNA (cytosine-5)-methyltransferase 1